MLFSYELAHSQTGGLYSGFTDIEAGLTGVSVTGGSESSAVWADFNNDDRLDLYYGGTSNGAAATRRLYLQNSDGSFTLQATNLPALFNPIIVAGDFDNDGYDDLYLSGDTSGSGDYISRIYRNNHNLTFTDVNAGLPSVLAGASWGDYDKDNDLDLLYGGSPEVYRNNGGVFSALNAGLPSGNGAVAWVDLDGDGDLDISLSVSGAFSSLFANYRNNGDGSFTDMNVAVQALSSGKMQWGDYEGDGDLDLFYSGFNDQLFTNEGYIYQNDGQGGLSLLTAGAFGYVGWLDLDGDGYLDLYGPYGVHINSYPQENDFNTTFPLPGSFTNNTRIWSDYDGDGDYDFFTSYTDSFELAYAQIYRFSPLLYGWVTDTQYTGIAGVQVDGGALGTRTTDSDGYYAFSQINRNSTFSLAPTLTGYAFSPTSSSGNLGNFSQVDFIASPAHSITGTIKLGEAPLAGVTVNGGSLGSSVTNTSGFYSFTGVIHETSYELTPILNGYEFAPSSAQGVLNEDTQINFSATTTVLPTHSITGVIRLVNAPLPGVRVDGAALGERITDANGEFSFNTVAQGTNYVLTPILAGYSFSPTNASGTLNTNIQITFSADACPTDDQKLLPGICGCGVVDDGIDTDGDSLANCIDEDDDGDQVSDEQETLDGSSSLDPGSHFSRLTTRACSEWNSFFDMWNVLENINIGTKNLRFETQLSRSDGQSGDARSLVVAPSGQKDLLLHNLTGWRPNDYGSICSAFQANEAGNFVGHMIYYKPAQSSDQRSFEFAFSLPFTNGRPGTQWVSWNTFQPSLNPNDSGNFVANWLTVRNLDASTQSGVLRVYDMQGTLINAFSLSLDGNERYDLGLHELGANRVGTAQWQPARADTFFSVYNSRYYYDNPYLKSSFASAALIEGQGASGETLAAPFRANAGSASVTSREVSHVTTGVSVITEILNALDQTQAVTYRLYNTQGNVLTDSLVRIPAHGARHIIADIDNVSELGMITVQGEQPGGVVATVLHYGRTPELSLTYAHARSLTEPLGQSFIGSYNSFLNQNSSLLLSNTSGEVRQVEVKLRRYDGAVIWESGEAITLKPHATNSLNLSDLVESNSYGGVEIDADATHALIGDIIRQGDTYAFSVPIAPIEQ